MILPKGRREKGKRGKGEKGKRGRGLKRGVYMHAESSYTNEFTAYNNHGFRSFCLYLQQKLHLISL